MLSSVLGCSPFVFQCNEVKKKKTLYKYRDYNLFGYGLSCQCGFCCLLCVQYDCALTQQHLLAFFRSRAWSWWKVDPLHPSALRMRAWKARQVCKAILVRFHLIIQEVIGARHWANQYNVISTQNWWMLYSNCTDLSLDSTP